MNATHTLLEEVRRLQTQKETGTLALTRKGQSVQVFYRDGLIDGATSNIELHRLGQYLVRGGYLESRELKPLLEDGLRSKLTLGQAAVRKKVLDVVELSDVVRRQVFQLIKHALENDFTIEGFKTHSPSFEIPAQISFEHLLLDLVRSNAHSLQIDPRRQIVAREDQDLSQWPWYPQELFVLSELKYPHTMESLSAATGMEHRRLSTVLDVFQKVGVIEILEAMTEGDFIPVGVEQENADADGPTTAVVKRAKFPLEHLIPTVTNAAISSKMEVLKNETSLISEQFKNLKVRIAEAGSLIPLKVLTVSSPNVRDGKSLVSANMAFSFSLDPSRRTIVIDCDLRNPTLDKNLGVSVDPGLIGYLESTNLRPHCFIRRVNNLYFMTAGGISDKPVELLSGPKMKELIEYLKTEFDTIILDSPPFAPISDARVITSLSDGLIVVVRMGETTYGSIQNALRVLDRNKLIGLVFNDVKQMPFHTETGYGYHGYKSQYPYAAPRKIRTRPKTYLEV